MGSITFQCTSDVVLRLEKTKEKALKYWYSPRVASRANKWNDLSLEEKIEFKRLYSVMIYIQAEKDFDRIVKGELSKDEFLFLAYIHEIMNKDGL